MIGANGKILVKVDLEQKSTTVINGVEIIMASKYDNNYHFYKYAKMLALIIRQFSMTHPKKELDTMFFLVK